MCGSWLRAVVSDMWKTDSRTGVGMSITIYEPRSRFIEAAPGRVSFSSAPVLTILLRPPTTPKMRSPLLLDVPPIPADCGLIRTFPHLSPPY